MDSSEGSEEMTKLSKHFDSSEFRCHCGTCGFDVVDSELLVVLEDLRETYGQPVTVTSGCRCQRHNKKIGGAPESYHTKGMAADIQVRGLSSAKVYQYLTGKYPDKYGIGYYHSWVHIDVRPKKSRWSGG